MIDPMGILTEEIESWIGRAGPEQTATVTREEIERYAAACAIEAPNPLFVDAQVAQASPLGAQIAPFGFYAVAFSKMAHHTTLQEDGLSGRSASEPRLRPPIPLSRTMAGGTEVEYRRPIRAGDVLTSEARIVDIVEKQGRSGPLVLTTTETTFRDAGGAVVCVEKLTMINR